MDLKERYNEPGIYVASNFSILEIHTLQHAFTEAVNLNASEILENAEDDEEVDLDKVPDKFIELSLIEADDSVTLTSDEIDNVRSTLIEFSRVTVETVRALLKETDRHNLFKADGIPHRIKLGRSALNMQQEFGGQNTSKRTADEDNVTKDTKEVEKFLASIPELASQGE